MMIIDTKPIRILISVLSIGISRGVGESAVAAGNPANSESPVALRPALTRRFAFVDCYIARSSDRLERSAP